eukprot:5687458-Lingulodinium_polyedra.AAC.1
MVLLSGTCRHSNGRTTNYWPKPRLPRPELDERSTIDQTTRLVLGVCHLTNDFGKHGGTSPRQCMTGRSHL